jgi:hypothetical protein
MRPENNRHERQARSSAASHRHQGWLMWPTCGNTSPDYSHEVPQGRGSRHEIWIHPKNSDAPGAIHHQCWQSKYTGSFHLPSRNDPPTAPCSSGHGQPPPRQQRLRRQAPLLLQYCRRPQWQGCCNAAARVLHPCRVPHTAGVLQHCCQSIAAVQGTAALQWRYDAAATERNSMPTLSHTSSGAAGR